MSAELSLNSKYVTSCLYNLGTTHKGHARAVFLGAFPFGIDFVTRAKV